MNISLAAVTLTTALTLFFTGSALVVDSFWGHEKGVVQTQKFSQAENRAPLSFGVPPVHARSTKSSRPKVRVKALKKRSKKQTPLKRASFKPKSFKKININKATTKELKTLPGVGPALAKRIVAYRKQHAFLALKDIKKVKGIGNAKFAKITDLIQVGR